MEALTTVGGNVELINNEKISSLAAFSNLTEVGGSLILKGCDMMQSLTGLQVLTSVGGELEIGGNTQLTTLKGIDNINPLSMSNLKISYNPVLSVCEVQSICDYLQSPDGLVIIINNATGCSSEDEVIASCANGIDDNINRIHFSLYPNPANEEVIIELQEDLQLHSVSVFNMLGKKVLNINPANNKVIVSSLDNGMFFLEISTNQGQAIQKLVIE